MKRTEITAIENENLPIGILRQIEGARIFDSSCSAAARVYYIERDGGYYLKCAEKGSLSREACLTRYYHSIGLGAEVMDYVSGERDYLFTRRVSGEDCTHGTYLENPKRLADILGTELRGLHEIRYTGCPITNRTAEYIATVEENYRTGNYDKSAFPDSFGYRSADEAYAVFSEGRSALCSDVLIHGDYCLPNVMLDGWRLSGFIDVGNGGVGDRHIDLFWGAWTLWFNLKTNAYRDRFLDAYGRDKIDLDLIKTVAAAEVFG